MHVELQPLLVNKVRTAVLKTSAVVLRVHAHMV